MHPPGAGTVLVRHGEIGIKSDQVRGSMERQLRDNIAAVLADRGISDSVERKPTRLFVHTTESRIETVTDAVTEVPGVASASPALTVDPTLDAICAALAETAAACYDGGTFAVRARRAGPPDAHPFSSTDIEREGGSAIWERADDEGIDPTVDLDEPDVTFHVECRQDDAYISVEKRAGPGGLPVGTQRPVVALVSGGIDSPVAAWEMLRRGCPVVPLYFDLGAYGGPDHRARAEATVARLAQYAPQEDWSLHVAPAGEVVQHLVESMTEMRMLALRRFMYRVAEHVAKAVDAVGIATGEAIGQKSSQTSANLAVTSGATTVPIHRPLLTADKADITERARSIGTFEEATVDAGCNRVAPSRPATAADPDRLREAEPDDLFDHAERVAADCEQVSLVTLTERA